MLHICTSVSTTSALQHLARHRYSVRRCWVFKSISICPFKGCCILKGSQMTRRSANEETQDNTPRIRSLTISLHFFPTHHTVCLMRKGHGPVPPWKSIWLQSPLRPSVTCLTQGTCDIPPAPATTHTLTNHAIQLVPGSGLHTPWTLLQHCNYIFSWAHLLCYPRWKQPLTTLWLRTKPSC